MMKIVVDQCLPRDNVLVDDILVTKLYGITHGNNPSKKYKLHVRADSGEVEAIGFLNSTGHLHEREKFTSLQDAFNYCKEKGHQMYQFDDAADFGAWLRA